jgi:antitoxin (DNA-binding transcriptional repressor) of toxin-antitoxin stability system
MNITVRELRANLSKYLSEGCTVVDGKTGKLIATISKPVDQTTKEYISYLEGQVAQFLKPSALEEERKLTYD